MDDVRPPHPADRTAHPARRRAVAHRYAGGADRAARTRDREAVGRVLADRYSRNGAPPVPLALRDGYAVRVGGDERRRVLCACAAVACRAGSRSANPFRRARMRWRTLDAVSMTAHGPRRRWRRSHPATASCRPVSMPIRRVALLTAGRPLRSHRRRNPGGARHCARFGPRADRTDCWRAPRAGDPGCRRDADQPDRSWRDRADGAPVLTMRS